MRLTRTRLRILPPGIPIPTRPKLSRRGRGETSSLPCTGVGLGIGVGAAVGLAVAVGVRVTAGRLIVGAGIVAVAVGVGPVNTKVGVGVRPGIVIVMDGNGPVCAKTMIGSASSNATESKVRSAADVAKERLEAGIWIPPTNRKM